MNEKYWETRKEYMKQLSPIRADLKQNEREDLNRILESKNQTVIGWIREKIDEDLKNI